MTPLDLIARALPDLVPLVDERETLRVVIASLALGGAERIVIEWLSAEVATGRACELALLHSRRHARAAPSGVCVLERRGESRTSRELRVFGKRREKIH